MAQMYGILFIVLFVGCNCTSRLINNYAEDPTFANMMCPADQMEFQRVTRSAVDCVGTCDRTPGCTSIIFLHDNKTCYGIKSEDPFSASSLLPGAVFYRPSMSSWIKTSAPSLNTTTVTTNTTSGSTGGSSSVSTTSAMASTATTRKPPTTMTAETMAAPTTTIETSTTRTTTAALTTAAPTTTATPATAAQTTAAKNTPTTATLTTASPTTTAQTTTAPTTNAPTTTAHTTVFEMTSNNPNIPMVIGVAASQLTASSYWTKDPGYSASDAKLNNTVTCWSVGSNSVDTNQFIQVDFLHQVQATHVITKGDKGYPEWVKSYKVLTSIDCASFIAVSDGYGNDKIFAGNSDRDSEVTNAIVPPVVCRCFRINPRTWNDHISIRFEVLGHDV